MSEATKWTCYFCGRISSSWQSCNHGNYYEPQALRDEVARLRGALEQIATEHTVYKEGGNSQYDIGVVDGHRCAAQIAKAALTPQGGKGVQGGK